MRSGISQARSSGAGTFNLLRHYATTSLVSVVVAAALLVALYRQLEIQENVELAQKSDVAAADTLFDSVRPQLGQYLADVARTDRAYRSDARIPAELASELAGMVRPPSVAAIEIYDDAGVIVYSTRSGRTGAVAAGNPGFASARRGEAVSEVPSRNWLDQFKWAADEEDVGRTYLPVRRSGREPVLGVIALETDYGPLRAGNEHEVRTVIAGVAAILLLLYAVLFFTVLRAHRIITTQQATIRERTETLEAVSAMLLNQSEIEKKKLANELQEDLAQTLSAIRMRIEEGLDPASATEPQAQPLARIVSALRGVVEELHHTAMALRPSSLDELGLLPTLHWYCRDFERTHPGVMVERKLLLREEEVPAHLKIEIYRVVETILKDIAEHAQSGRIELALAFIGDTLALSIDAAPAALDVGAPEADAAARARLDFVIAKERTKLSGGRFSVARARRGALTLRADWPIAASERARQADRSDADTLAASIGPLQDTFRNG